MEKSALNVNKGIEQPEVTDNNSIKRFLQKKRQVLTADYYVKGILEGNRTILSQAITLVESTSIQHQAVAQEIIEKCLPHSGRAMRIGITGVPGVGKSTFIEACGLHITSLGLKLAVLAIDPSSERSKGSILGDKTRMEDLTRNPNAFIRPSPSTGSLGGVARKTRESMILCEAAGFDVIFIETVGVGQSETTVHSMVDFFLLLMLAGAGDELQGIKRGIMEMADTIVITKADGANIPKAKMAMGEYRNALHLFPPTESGWTPEVTTSSSLDNIGIENVWKITEKFFKFIKDTRYIDKKRNEQAKYWMYETINNKLYQDFYENAERKILIKEMEQQVLEGKLSSFQAAFKLLDSY